MYTFVKIKNTYKDLNIEYPYMFRATSAQDIIDFNKAYLGPIIEEGVVDLASGNKHARTFWRNTVEQLAAIKGSSFLQESMNLEIDLASAKHQAILKYGEIYINKNGGFTIPTEYMYILDSIEKEDLVFPNKIYTEKDIKITRWPKGIHYYAKIEGVDVKDEYGDLKWSSHEIAFNKAKEFLLKMNKV